VRAIAISLVAATLLAGALILEVPATLVDARLAAATDNRLRLADARGSLWRGTGTLRIDGVSGGQIVSWQLEPWPLLRGTLAVALGADPAQAPTATLRATPSRLEIRRLDFIALPAAAALHPLAPGVPPVGGMLLVHVPSLDAEGSAAAGQIRLTWRDAMLPAATAAAPLSLGTVTAELTARGNAWAGSVTNAGGEIAISGPLGWRPGAVDGDLVLAPRPGLAAERQEAVAAALAAIGRPDGRGGYRVRLPGPAT
jgi:general secretion pathway protein N